MKIGGTQPKTLLLGCLIGVAGGVAVVPWIGAYGTLTGTGVTEVAVANAFVPVAPVVTESVATGIAIYMLAAIGLGIWRMLSPRQPSPMDGFIFIAALSTVAAVGVVVEGYIVIARASAHADKVLVF
jgi:hypothetical protein